MKSKRVEEEESLLTKRQSAHNSVFDFQHVMEEEVMKQVMEEKEDFYST